MEDTRWLDPDEMRAWRSLLAANSRLLATLDAELQADCDLPLADYEVLVFVSEAPEDRMRMADLADLLNLSPSGLTRRVDRLVRAGLVCREQCPSDKRGSFAVLTEAGRKRLVEAAPRHVRHVRQHFIDRFDRDGLAALADALDVIIAACPPRP